MPRGSRGLGGQTGRRLCSSPFHQVLGVPRFRQNGCPGRSLGSAGKLISVCSEHSLQKMVQGPTGWLWLTGCWHLGLSLPMRPEGGEGGGTPPSPGESAPKASGAGFVWNRSGCQHFSLNDVICHPCHAHLCLLRMGASLERWRRKRASRAWGIGWVGESGPKIMRSACKGFCLSIGALCGPKSQRI